jgi:hypothetical protein
MLDFELNPLEVGNFSAIGLWENIQEERVDKMIKWILRNYGIRVPSYLVDEMIKNFEVDYFNLPQYLVNRIDNAFEVYEKEEE